MVWENNPGHGSVLQNKNKKNDKAPDFTGDVKDPNGVDWDVAVWVTETKTGLRRLSIRLQKPYGKKDDPLVPVDDPLAPTQELDDDIPF